eukprot:TRINITY_DN1486_c0_g1_i1.p2 TRINITY_DN1486_c0_g1~~TRINITY_DN1486_c0_g1_i1.p2  ORF type:complete len:109 (+),score=42.76 TRINITY_DN1486_c0_g1_i1:43-327(+)
MATPNVYYAVGYEYVPDVLEKRQPHREQHIELLKKHFASGKLKQGGAYDPPTDGALLIFTDKAAAEEFVKSDPYVLNGIVTKHTLKAWTVLLEQ